MLTGSLQLFDEEAACAACLALRGCLPWCYRRDRCQKLEASVSEMQECLHEEECGRREVRLC